MSGARIVTWQGWLLLCLLLLLSSLTRQVEDRGSYQVDNSIYTCYLQAGDDCDKSV